MGFYCLGIYLFFDHWLYKSSNLKLCQVDESHRKCESLIIELLYWGFDISMSWEWNVNKPPDGRGFVMQERVGEDGGNSLKVHKRRRNTCERSRTTSLRVWRGKGKKHNVLWASSITIFVTWFDKVWGKQNFSKSCTSQDFISF